MIPESPDAVRIDLVGGFVLQKVTPQRSYFRLVIIAVLQLSLVMIYEAVGIFVGR